jgi:hypothetical protein
MVQGSRMGRVCVHFLRVNGAKTNNISVTSNDLRKAAKKPIDIAPDVNAAAVSAWQNADGAGTSR